VRPVHVCGPTRGLALLRFDRASRSRGNRDDRSGACCAGDGVMEKHTPGPWSIDWNVTRLDIYGSDERTLIATLRRSALSEGVDAAARASARLIVAAPCLLAALREVSSYLADRSDVIDGDDGQPEPNAEMTLLREVDAAIAKATGDK